MIVAVLRALVQLRRLVHTAMRVNIPLIPGSKPACPVLPAHLQQIKVLDKVGFQNINCTLLLIDLISGSSACISCIIGTFSDQGIVRIKSLDPLAFVVSMSFVNFKSELEV